MLPYTKSPVNVMPPFVDPKYVCDLPLCRYHKKNTERKIKNWMEKVVRGRELCLQLQWEQKFNLTFKARL